MSLTVEQASAILRSVAPAAEVRDVVRYARGTVSGAYDIRCAAPEDDVVIKVYGADSPHRAAKEYHVYRLLAEHGVSAIPGVRHAEFLDTAIGRPFLVLGKLAGRAVAEVVDGLAEPEVVDVYRQMGRLLAEIHRVTRPEFGYLLGDRAGLVTHHPQSTNAAYLKAMVAEKLADLRAAGAQETLCAAVERHITERADLFAGPAQARLLHLDFHEGNVLVDLTPHGPRVTGCIDVENAVAGDPLADLARLDAYCVKGDEAKLRGLREGYGEFPTQWREKMDLYQVVHLVELAAWFHRIGDHARYASVTAEIDQALTAAR